MPRCRRLLHSRQRPHFDLLWCLQQGGTSTAAAQTSNDMSMSSSSITLAWACDAFLRWIAETKWCKGAFMERYNLELKREVSGEKNNWRVGWAMSVPGWPTELTFDTLTTVDYLKSTSKDTYITYIFEAYFILDIFTSAWQQEQAGRRRNRIAWRHHSHDHLT